MGDRACPVACAFAASGVVALLAVVAGTVVPGLGATGRPPAEVAAHIPAFSRLYRTGCTTCHSAAPKLNVLGEAFRLNGYRFPENDLLLREQEAVPLGTDAWEEEWPRAIWPADLPSVPPVAFRIVNDLQVTADDTEDFTWTYRFPVEVHVPAGGAIGDDIGFFLEIDWDEDEGFGVAQAKVALQDLVPFLPRRALNLWIGQQNLFLLTFGNEEIDTAAREPFLWATFDPADPVLPGGLRSPNDLALGAHQPAIELNGLVERRTYWAFGLAQGTTDIGSDDNDAKDVYWKLRHKFGGLALDGTYDDGSARVTARGGQLHDRALVIEHFGYLGEANAIGDATDEYRAFGLAARWLDGPLDLGGGFVWVRNDDPWGMKPAVALERWSAFARGEVFLWPWLIGSLKAETLRFDLDPEAPPVSPGPLDRTRILPGLVALLRQNVRAVLEAELWTDHEPSAAAGLGSPHNLWLRLDIAF